MNTTTTFESASVKDRVWSVEYGWGTVHDTSYRAAYPILVKFAKNTYVAFRLNGTRLHCSNNQTLFWDEVKIKAPTKPLPELAVE